MLTCKKQHSAKYTERNTPPYDANTCKVGTSRKGNNGLMYVVSPPNRNGFKRWVQKSPTTPTRTTRRTTRRRPVYTRRLPVYRRRRPVYTRRRYYDTFSPRRRRDDFWSDDDVVPSASRSAAAATRRREKEWKPRAKAVKKEIDVKASRAAAAKWAKETYGIE